MAEILIADDDPHIRDVVQFALEQAGHDVTAVSDGAAALAHIEKHGPELVVLDIMMPTMDGIEVCRQARAKSTVPILFLSARDEEVDRVIGLEVGGDDYMTKPFGPRELVARVKAMLRRVAMVKDASRPSESEAIAHGDLGIDPVRFEVTWKANQVVLTVTEFGLLEALAAHPGKVYTRGELVELSYKFDNHVTERTIDTHVRRIRKKFAADGEPIETVFGLGYRLGACGRG